MIPNLDLYTISLWVLPVLLAITLHEAAHGYAAWRLGDDTAYKLGRVSANPFRHVDPFGTVLLPGMLLLSGSSFMFGYAKPVPVKRNKLHQPRRDSVLVAAAGPAANLLIAVASAVLIHVVQFLPEEAASWSKKTLYLSLGFNVFLAVLNMLPVPPLDGSRVVLGLLPPRLALPYSRLFRFGLWLVLGLFILPPLIGRNLGINLDIIGWIVGPPVQYLSRLIQVLAGHA